MLHLAADATLRPDAPSVSIAPHSLRVVDGLPEGARKALDTNHAEVITRWLSAVTGGSRRIYRRALARFTAWAIPDATAPHQGLELLCQSGAGTAHNLLIESFCGMQFRSERCTVKSHCQNRAYCQD